MTRHRLTSYRASLVNVLKAQVKSERVEPGLEGVMQLAESVALQVRFLTTFHVAPTATNRKKDVWDGPQDNAKATVG